MKKLVIIDEYFSTKSGHHYTYNKSVQELFKAHGIPATTYANERLEADIREELKAVPYLKGLPRNALNKIPILGQLCNRIRFWISLYRRLRKLYQEENAADTVFFYTTVVWYNVLPVALAACRDKRTSMLLYRLSFAEMIDFPKVFSTIALRIYGYTFKKMQRHGKILFFTDSDVIAAEGRSRFEVPVHVLPIPHLPESTPANPSGFAVDQQARLRLYVPGAIREEKGIDFITGAFEYLDQLRSPLLDRIILVTQYNGSGSQELNTAIRERLSRLPVQNVFLGNLSTEDYERQMREADAILIPYDVEQGYRARTSGILSETIAACKPFITSSDSWMSIQAEKYNTGLTITYGSKEAFGEALAALLQHYHRYLEQAINARAAWLDFHSRDNFYRIIMGNIQVMQSQPVAAASE